MTLAEVKDRCGQAEDLYRAGRFVEGAAAAEAAVIQCARDLGKTHYAYPLALCTAGWLRRESGDAAGANDAFTEAVGCARALADGDFENAISVLEHAALFYAEAMDEGQARDLGYEVLNLLRVNVGPGHPRFYARAAKLKAGMP